MTQSDFQTLVVQTLRTPGEAATRLLALNLPRRWLWMAMALMCVLNSIVYSVSLQLSPPTDPAALAMIPPAFQSPVLFTMFLFGALVITVFVLQWIGQAMGGKAELGDILVLLTWLQVMRFLFQLSILILSLVSLTLSAVLVLVGSIWAIYILAVFLNTAHRFDNLGKALGVMVLALVSIAVGLTLILGALGAAILGGTGNV